MLTTALSTHHKGFVFNALAAELQHLLIDVVQIFKARLLHFQHLLNAWCRRQDFEHLLVILMAVSRHFDVIATVKDSHRFSAILNNDSDVALKNLGKALTYRLTLYKNFWMGLYNKFHSSIRSLLAINSHRSLH